MHNVCIHMHRSVTHTSTHTHTHTHTHTRANLVAGKGEACSHIAALMFYLEDFTRQGHSDLPTDFPYPSDAKSNHDHAQLISTVCAVMQFIKHCSDPLLGQHKGTAARLCTHLSVIATTHTSLTPNPIMTMHS